MRDVRLPDFSFTFPVQVWFRDLDAMGHVNNAVYLSYCEQARTEYWLSLMGREPNEFEIDPRRLGFVVVHIECSFHSPAFLGQPLLVGCRLSDIKTTSFDFHYRIISAEKDASDTDFRLVATGKSVQVLYDWNGKKKIPFSEELKARIAAREGSSLKIHGG
ncbi:MAG: acyl-CoA thioesterase [Acidobacteria bacterium]|nr:acyl-CoA thioesterase [Acidobacteriota bacterium]MCG3194803.1 Acyl-CoA thioesterase YbgC [Thermoanaerobaculia bacterium]MCK6685277.1 acyl-CoA thioesterase [Thermoanaerobaculia bacterium]